MMNNLETLISKISVSVPTLPRQYTDNLPVYVGKKPTESIEIAGLKVAYLVNEPKKLLKSYGDFYSDTLDYLDWDYWFGDED